MSPEQEISPDQTQEMIVLLQDMILVLNDLKMIGYWIFSALFLFIGLMIVQLFFVGKGND